MKTTGKIKSFLNNYKSITAILVFCAVVFLLVFGANSKFVEKRSFDTIDNIKVPDHLVSPRNYEIVDGNYYISQTNDPQIFLIPDKWPTANDVTIKFAEPVKMSLMLQLFVSCHDYEISEQHSYVKTVNPGATEVFFSLPYDDYTLMRLDINGNFRLDGIWVSNLENVKYYDEFQVSWLKIILCLAIITVIIALCIIFKDKVETYFQKIVKNYFSHDNTALELKRDSSRSLANQYAFLAIMLGSLFLFLVPALRIPDEIFHFLNVVKISHFQFAPSVKDGVEGVYLTLDEVSFFKEFGNIDDRLMSWNRLSKSTLTNSVATEFYATSSARTNLFGHFIPGIAVAIVRIFFDKIDVYSCLLIARLTNLLVSVLITRFAIIITPVFKNTMVLFALMPVTLQLVSSASYDSILIASSFLFFAITMKIVMKNDDYRISNKDIAIVLFSISGICAMKSAYALVAVFLFSISIKKFGNIKKYFSCIGLVITCGILFSLLPTVICNIAVSEIPAQGSGLEQQQLEFLLSDVSNIPKVFIETYEHWHEDWEKQFFGVLGWLDFGLPNAFYAVFILVFWLTFIFDACTAGKVPLKTRILSMTASIIVYIVIVMSMYISWNVKLGEICGYVANGVQGRYFIPLALFVVIVFSNSVLKKFKHLEKIESKIFIVIKMFSIASVLAAFFAFYQRYWR